MREILQAINNLKILKKSKISDSSLVASTMDLLEQAECKLDDKAEQYCHWFQQDFNECETWQTCENRLFNVLNGTPLENAMRFCPYCGKNIVEHSYAEQNDTHDTDDSNLLEGW